jgi:hypothetical protein
MCKPHWTEYTRELRKASVARKAEVDAAPEPVADPEPPSPPKGRRAKAAPGPEADAA